MTCKFITKKNNQCTRKAKKGDFCTQHHNLNQIKMLKKELSIIHKKNRILSEENKELQKYKHQINTINEFDRIKQKLIQINPYIKFKYLITDRRYESRLEDVFNISFDRIEKIYRQLLYDRNDLCHPYTSRYWAEPRGESFHPPDAYDDYRDLLQ
jgi:outer membrane phospholipase A